VYGKLPVVNAQKQLAQMSKPVSAWIEQYLQAQKAALSSIPVQEVAAIIEKLRAAVNEQRNIFVAGNGGSASNASHFATDLGKGSSDKIGRRFRVLSLNDNVSWISAIANDYSYEEIFVRQLMNYARAGDILIVLSVSGSSSNLVRAVQWANENGLHTVGLLGGKRGKLVDLCTGSIVIDSTHYGRVEDAQMGICHMLCYAFMELPDELR